MPYMPATDEVIDPTILRDFIHRHPLATLVTHDGIHPDADLIPLILLPGHIAESGQRQPDRLVGHVARNNPMWKPARSDGEVLAIFGPVHHDISATWYPSKQRDHRAAPTWDYLVVHAWGHLIIHDDPMWCLAAVSRLTQHMEKGRRDPWHVGQAPRDYVADLMTKIVGIELVVERLQGKFKLSSHKSEADRRGARDALALEAQRTGAGSSLDELISALGDPDHARGRRRDDADGF